VAAIARVHTWRGTFDKGVAQIRGVLHGLGEDVSSHGLCALYLALAHLLFRTGRYGEQLEAAERAAEIARAVEDKALLAEAELQRAYSLPWTGRQEDFAPALEGVIRLAEEIGELTTLCRALCAVSYPYSERGDFEKSRLSLDRALEVAERIGDPARIAFATYLCGLDRFWRGEWDNAERLFKRSLATYQELGAVSDVMIPLYGLGALRMAAGDWEEGARMLEEHTAIAHETGDLRWIHAVQALLAERDLLEGRPDQGRARLERFLDLPGTSPTAIGAVLPTLAWACLQTGDTARGEEIAARATAQARAEHDQRNLVEALRVQGLVMSRQERWSEAEQCFGEALSLVERMPYPYARGRVLYDYGLMCRDQGELTKARELLTAALAVFRRLGARPHSERTERALLSTPAPGR
jgi:tetratricopeptide (TPR) repeat protein